MKGKELIGYCLEVLKKAGADKAQCKAVESSRHELSIDTGDISLFRTVYNTNINLTAISQGKKASISINKADEAAIDKAVSELMDSIETVPYDEANDISPLQAEKEFTSGESQADVDKMYTALKELLEKLKVKYPETSIDMSFMHFTHTQEYFGNTSGVYFATSKGQYGFEPVIITKSGKKTSSDNYTFVSFKNIDRELIKLGSVEELIDQSSVSVETTPIEGKFDGEVIITPDCLLELVKRFTDITISDRVLVAGTSLFKEKLNCKVADEKLTLHSNPLAEELADGYYVTEDGFEAQNSTLIENGILKSFILTQYGANKTKREISANPGGAFVIDAGQSSYADMIKSIKKGILLCRYSGGRPSDDGEFSCVAKNSFYIENGEIKYPISETMISGNLFEAFNSIRAISQERVNFGNAVMPYIKVSGLNISGK